LAVLGRIKDFVRKKVKKKSVRGAEKKKKGPFWGEIFRKKT